MYRTILSLLLAFTGLLLFTSAALAHERRTVGKYELEVGWHVEPALLDQPNSLHLEVKNEETNQPVTGLEQTLKAQVIFGGKMKELTLYPRRHEPGEYGDDIIPTRPGAYTFRIFGTIEGMAVDERFTAGPGRFDEVEPPTEAQFPEESPSPSELAPLVTGAQEAARQAQQAVGSARTLGLIGIVIGALGVAVGGTALTLARRRR